MHKTLVNSGINYLYQLVLWFLPSTVCSIGWNMLKPPTRYIVWVGHTMNHIYLSFTSNKHRYSLTTKHIHPDKPQCLSCSTPIPPRELGPHFTKLEISGRLPSLKLTFSHLKKGRNAPKENNLNQTINFQGRTVSFRECSVTAAGSPEVMMVLFKWFSFKQMGDF